MENKNTTKKTKKSGFIILAALVALLVAGVSIFVVYKYAPSRERVKLTDYFKLSAENEVAVVVNGEYKKTEDQKPYAVKEDGKVYLNKSFVNSNIDDGYAYDDAAQILRYTTDKNVITAKVGESTFSVDKSMEDAGFLPVIDKDGEAYLAADWIKNYSDITFYTKKNPNRIIIETAGWKRKVGKVSKNTEIRRHGGNKSPILSDIKKGQKVIHLEEYGKWSKVLTDDGVIGCIKDSCIEDLKEKKAKNNLEKREYEHIKFDGKIVMAWHQTTNPSANKGIDSILKNESGINVISPTWFSIKDNDGNISNNSSREYVNKCHEKGIQVWGLIGNVENKDVNSTSVLNRTSSRDNLVDQTVAAAIAAGLDGINVDIEAIRAEAKDGYLAFIKELSLKCKKNGLILSVDNYVPTEYTSFYGRKVQADYADYIIVMAYDEHYSGSAEAGSVSSYSFVKNGVENTLKEVPADQLILGLPFFTRVWCTDNGTVSSEAMGMDDAKNRLEENGAEITWNDEAGQNYGEYKTDNKLYQCWMEDAKSLGNKMQLAEQNKLAGVTFWKLGFENSSIWDTVNSTIKK